MNAQYRVDSIFQDEELGDYFAKCFDLIYDEEFEKYLGLPDEYDGKQNASTLLKDSAYEMSDEVREEIMTTFGVAEFDDEESFSYSDDFDDGWVEDDEEDMAYAESFNLREALNRIDLATDNSYDLLNLYEACSLSENEKKALGKIVYSQQSPEVIYDTLNNRFVNGEEIEMPERDKDGVIHEDEMSEGFTYDDTGTNVEVYSDYYIAKKRANELGLKMAEFGDLDDKFSYCFWNESGDRYADEQVLAYYKFVGSVPAPLDEFERQIMLDRYEKGPFDNEVESFDDEEIGEGFKPGDKVMVKPSKKTGTVAKVNGDYIDVEINGGKDPDRRDTFYPNDLEPLNEDVNKEDLKSKLERATRDFVVNTLGYDDEFVNDYIVVSVTDSNFYEGEPAIKCEVRTELDYEECSRLAYALNPIVEAEDKQAYFDMETNNVTVAYLRTDFSDDVVEERFVAEFAPIIARVDNMDELRKLYQDIKDSFEGVWTYATFEAVHELIMAKADELNGDTVTESVLTEAEPPENKQVIGKGETIDKFFQRMFPYPIEKMCKLLLEAVQIYIDEKCTTTEEVKWFCMRTHDILNGDKSHVDKPNIFKPIDAIATYISKIDTPRAKELAEAIKPIRDAANKFAYGVRASGGPELLEPAEKWLYDVFVGGYRELCKSNGGIVIDGNLDAKHQFNTRDKATPKTEIDKFNRFIADKVNETFYFEGENWRVRPLEAYLKNEGDGKCFISIDVIDMAGEEFGATFRTAEENCVDAQTLIKTCTEEAMEQIGRQLKGQFKSIKQRNITQDGDKADKSTKAVSKDEIISDKEVTEYTDNLLSNISKNYRFANGKTPICYVAGAGVGVRSNNEAYLEIQAVEETGGENIEILIDIPSEAVTDIKTFKSKCEKLIIAEFEKEFFRTYKGSKKVSESLSGYLKEDINDPDEVLEFKRNVEAAEDLVDIENLIWGLSDGVAEDAVQRAFNENEDAEDLQTVKDAVIREIDIYLEDNEWLGESLFDDDDEDKPYTYTQVYDELKLETRNFTIDGDTIQYGYISEAEYAEKILKRHYASVVRNNCRLTFKDCKHKGSR